ncbi:hypothetical protein CLBKND_04921 [Methylorubrum aminovorans]
MPEADAPRKVLRVETNALDHRVESYPDLGEQVGALMKGMRALIDGKPIPQETIAMVERIEAVKARFPKPAEPQPED